MSDKKEGGGKIRRRRVDDGDNEVADGKGGWFGGSSNQSGDIPERTTEQIKV